MPVFSSLNTCSTLSPWVISPKSLDDSSKVITGPLTSGFSFSSCALAEITANIMVNKKTNFFIFNRFKLFDSVFCNIKLRIKVHHKQFFCCSGHCRVEPSDIFFVQLLIGQKSLIYKDSGPLPTLGFMTGKGIGKLNLQ